MKLSDYIIIPSNLKYKSAPTVDQKLVVPLDNESKNLNEFDRIRTVNLAQVYDDERQNSTLFRPTFEITYIYDNKYIGVTNYVPFMNSLVYYNPELSVLNNIWSGTPQFYEFDFFRPEVNDGHFTYEPVSAYTYNWLYYITYPFENNYNEVLFYQINNTTSQWVAKDGIPFIIDNISINGDNLISFQCVAPHGLSIGENVQLTISYANKNLFEVYSLGNGLLGSEEYIFNVYNVGYTGTTFFNGRKGSFKRVIYPDLLSESTSKYYVRKHKVLSIPEDLVMTKTGFQKNAFQETSKIYLSSITPNLKTRICKNDSSNAYTITTKRDVNISGLSDNQKRPLTELFLTIINKGYSGYFNKPVNNIGLKQGWGFNVTEKTNQWWSDNNLTSNSNIAVSSYSLTDISGNTKTFYYNNQLNTGDTIDGDFCEWNDYEQVERVISPYYHKLKFNQNNFQISQTPTTNGDGFYYRPHSSVTIRVFSNYIESGDVTNVDQVPFWSFYSNADNTFRWRDLYTYGYIDELGRGVNYPYLNNSHYPYQDITFRLMPEGSNSNDTLNGINQPIKPLIDGCE